MNEWEIAIVFGGVGLALGVLLGRIWAYSNIISDEREVIEENRAEVERKIKQGTRIVP